jgi:hypothetical protein
MQKPPSSLLMLTTIKPMLQVPPQPPLNPQLRPQRRLHLSLNLDEGMLHWYRLTQQHCQQRPAEQM